MTIKELRASLGLTMRELSEVLGIPRRTLENWEYGTRPMPDYMMRLIEFYCFGCGRCDRILKQKKDASQ